MLIDLQNNQQNADSVWLDTTVNESHHWYRLNEQNHHQGLARSHKLSDGSIYYFLSHSLLNYQPPGGPLQINHGLLMQFRYQAGTDGEHIKTAKPYPVAKCEQRLPLIEQHPSDICFLQDVNNTDAGYLFVTLEMDARSCYIYYWEPGQHFFMVGAIYHGVDDKTKGDPNFVFIDKVGDQYYLGLASNNTGKGTYYVANANALFPSPEKGNINLNAFYQSPGVSFNFPLSNHNPNIPSQNKLIRDSTGAWFLLAYRSDDDGQTKSNDYIDVHEISFSRFHISIAAASTHIILPSGDTSFTNTGTHHVEKSGRLLVCSSYRWSEDQGPDGSSYVSRVDELAS